jgi:hypothetical protein
MAVKTLTLDGKKWAVIPYDEYLASRTPTRSKTPAKPKRRTPREIRVESLPKWEQAAIKRAMDWLERYPDGSPDSVTLEEMLRKRGIER